MGQAATQENSVFGGDFEKSTNTGRTSASQYIDPISYTQPGTYELEVGECKHHSGYGDDSFIAEFTVIKSDVPNKTEGQSVAMVKKFTKASRVFALRDIRQFIAAATGIPFDETTETNYKAVVSAKQPLMGIVVKCVAYDTVSPKKDDQGRDRHFTNMKWSLVKGK